MAKQVNVLEAKNRLSELVRAAKSGEEIVIANRGEPVARLLAFSDVQAPWPARGNPDAILDWLKTHPLPPYARRSEAEIDADIERERSSWD